MKTIALILIMLISVNLIPAQSGWFQVRSENYTAYFSTYFTSLNTGYMVGAKLVSGTSYPRVIKTSNAGNNWFEQFTPVSDTAGLIFDDIYFLDANTGIATLFHNSNFGYGRILRTTNGGTNWFTVHIPEYSTNIWFVNTLTGYVSGHHYIFKTTDGGVSWINQNPNFTQVLGGIYFTDVNTGYVVGNNNTIRKTTDAGENWFTLSLSTPNRHLWGVSFINSSTGFIVGGYSTQNNIILKTTDAGNNWIQIPYSYSNQWLYSVRFISPSTGYIIGWGSQVLKTTNGGLNWFNQILPASNYCGRSVYFTDANTGYIAGHPYMPPDSINYIFKTTTGGEVLGIKLVSNEIPEQYSLSQNYPNPFNPVTKIKFEIPLSRGVGAEGGRSVFAKLYVYDILGREFAVLVDEKLSPGTYEVDFDGKNYPSGVYFYTLRTGDFTDTKKMLLVK